MNQYHGPGMIRQIPATKRYWIKKGDPAHSRTHSFMRGHIYRGVNENDGRKIPDNTIGAAYRHTNANGPTWERGLERIDIINVRLIIHRARK